MRVFSEREYSRRTLNAQSQSATVVSRYLSDRADEGKYERATSDCPT